MISIERQAFGFIRTVIGRSAKLSLNLPNERTITERDPHTVEQNRTFSSSKSNENRTEPNAYRTEAEQPVVNMAACSEFVRRLLGKFKHRIGPRPNKDRTEIEQNRTLEVLR